MNVQINPTSDEESSQKSKIRKKYQNDTGLGIIARTVICILILDSIIWGYFRIIKNVSMAEGWKGWQQSIQKIIGIEEVPLKVRNRTIIVDLPNPQNTRATPENRIPARPRNSITVLQRNKTSTSDEIQNIEAKMEMAGNHDETIYSWKDEDGKIHYSNTGFPEGNIERLWARKQPN